MTTKATNMTTRYVYWAVTIGLLTGIFWNLTMIVVQLQRIGVAAY